MASSGGKIAGLLFTSRLHPVRGLEHRSCRWAMCPSVSHYILLDGSRESATTAAAAITRLIIDRRGPRRGGGRQRKHSHRVSTLAVTLTLLACLRALPGSSPTTGDEIGCRTSRIVSWIHGSTRRHPGSLGLWLSVEHWPLCASKQARTPCRIRDFAAT